jgi:hypothetical protein
VSLRSESDELELSVGILGSSAFDAREPRKMVPSGTVRDWPTYGKVLASKIGPDADEEKAFSDSIAIVQTSLICLSALHKWVDKERVRR